MVSSSRYPPTSVPGAVLVGLSYQGLLSECHWGWIYAVCHNQSMQYDCKIGLKYPIMSTLSREATKEVTLLENLCIIHQENLDHSTACGGKYVGCCVIYLCFRAGYSKPL